MHHKIHQQPSYHRDKHNEQHIGLNDSVVPKYQSVEDQTDDTLTQNKPQKVPYAEVLPPRLA